MTVSLPFATLVLYLVLIQPNHPGALTWEALLAFPLELPAIVFGLIAGGDGRIGRILRVVLTVVLTLIVVLKGADIVSFNALSRGFNPVADMALVDAFIRLLTGSVGPVLAVLAVVGAGIVTVVVAALLWWAMAQWARFGRPGTWSRFLVLPAVLSAGVVVAEVGATMGRWSLPIAPPGTAFTARVAVERFDMARRTLAELQAFRIAVQQDPFRGSRDLLDRIDRDVLVIFVESYGRTSIDTPFYASVHRDTLDASETRLGALGLSTRSGYLAAPTRGGQSWLSHATVANGLWVDNQVGYGAALSSGRETLYHHAANNGFRTAAVMPQITLEWPESARMGFETVLASKDLGYAGLPFNWVTMPDQFTLAALDRLVRSDTDPRSVFAQVALATSHAPWVPVPDIIPWDEVGDGQVYNAVAVSGDPPDVVWRDRERVRVQYRLAIDYALRAVFEYAALHAGEPPLMIVIGDHQAAEFVALDRRPDVPVHVIGPTHLVDALSDIAPTPGLVPADDSAVLPMDRLRDIVLTVFSTRFRSG
ncbi:MAG: sulfatase [Jannaschia sp.]